MKTVYNNIIEKLSTRTSRLGIDKKKENILVNSLINLGQGKAVDL